MKRIGRLILIGLVAVIVLVGLAYAWGASGRRTVQSELERVRQQLDVTEARALLLDARVALYNMNYGDASRRFEEAKGPLRRIRQAYADDGMDDKARTMAAALEHIEEAQRLAGKLDPAANTRAGEALEAIRLATQ